MNIYEQMMEDDASSAGAAVSAAVGPSPAKGAKAVNLGGESGVPPSVVFMDPEGWEDQIKQQKAADLVRLSPYLQRYIGSDPMAAPTSYDDMEALDNFANASAAFAAMHRDQTAVAIPKWTPPPLVTPAEKTRVAADLPPGTEIPEGNPMVAEPPAAPLVVPNSADEVVRRAKLLSDQRDKSGLSPLPMATAVEAFDPKGFAEDMTGLQSWLATKNLPSPLNQLTLGVGGALDLSTRLTAAGLGFFSGAAENVAPGLSRDVNLLGQTVLALLGAEYFHPAEPRVVANSKAIETLGRLADESATKEMAKPLFNDFAHQMLGDQTIEIPFEALRKVYEAHGEVPHGSDGILGFVPDLADQVARAAHTNGDVTVNLADFLTHADPKVREELAPDLRAHPADPTPNELVVARDELEEAIKEEAKKGAAEEAIRSERDALREKRTAAYDAAVEAEARGDTRAAEKFKEEVQSYDKPIEELSAKLPMRTTALEVTDAQGRPIRRPGEEAKAEGPKAGEVVELPKARTFEELKAGGEGKIAELEAASEEAMQRAEAHSTEFQVEFEKAKLEVPKAANEEFYGEHDSALHLLSEKGKAAIKAHVQESNEASRLASEGLIRRLEDFLPAGYTADIVPVESHAGSDLWRKVAGQEIDYRVQVYNRDGGLVGGFPKHWKARGAPKWFDDLMRRGDVPDLFTKAHEEALIAIGAKQRPEAEIVNFPGPKATPAARVREEMFLDPLVTEPKALGMTVEEFAVYSRNAEARAAEVEEKATAVATKVTELQGQLDELQGRRAQASAGAEVAISEGRFDEAASLQTEAAALDRPIARLEGRIAAQPPIEDLVFSEPITKNLHDDLRVMRRQIEGEEAPPINLKEMERWAREQIASMTVKDVLKLKQSLLGTIKRNGREAYMEALKGNKAKALKARNEQFLAQLLGKEAINFVDEWNGYSGRQARFSRQDVVKGVEQGYTDQIQVLLTERGIPISRRDNMGDVPPLKEFVDSKAGWLELAVSDWLYNDREPQRPESMTVERFREFAQSLESLEHNGRFEQMVDRAGKAADLKATLDEAVANIREEPLQFPEGGAKYRYIWGIDASLTRMEKFIDIWDKHDTNGPLNDTVYRPLTAAKHHETELFKWAADRVRALPKLKDGKVRITDVPFENSMLREDGVMVRRPYQFTRADVVNIAFNWGNKRNRDLVIYTMEGANIADKLSRVAEADKPIVSAMLHDLAENKIIDWVNATLTKDEWAFVNGLWGVFKDLKPEIDALYRRTAGVAPDTVEGLGVSTPHGDFDGGYAPIVYDPFMSDIKSKKAEILFENQYRPSTVPNGHTKRRTNVYKKLKLEGGMDLLGLAIRQQIHDLAYKEAVQNAWKVLRDPRLQQAITDHYGSEYSDLLQPWLQNIANRFNNDDRRDVWLTNLSRDLRTTFATAVLGANLRVIMTPNIAPVLTRFMVDPLFAQRIMQNFDKPHAFVMEHSAEIRNRMANAQRDISEELSSQVGLESGWDQYRQVGAYWGMVTAVKIDQLLGEVVWLHEYDKLIQTMNHDDAVYAADKAIRDGFGSHSRVDLPSIMTKGEGWKWTSLFYGFGSTMWNKDRDILRMVKEGVRRSKAGGNTGANRNFGMILASTMAFVVVTALFNVVYQPLLVKRNKKEDNDIDFGATAANLLLSQLSSTVPVLREGVNYLLSGREPGAAPIISFPLRALTAAQDVAKIFPGGDEPRHFIKSLGTLLSFWPGGPFVQPATSGQFVWDLTTGQQEAHNLWDVIVGLVYGESGAKKR